ncbi:efflux RND transporter permease subunit [Neptunicella marina]|uniref:Efflux RND transporter permease subunit n=1 Tax=Neptunicella marina TaxID=2125989 RepID=A0A8J6M2F2_9ALTE|nr:CusA/CzcA family heavy metal efflux RND transporter [Neptunicella marina]MBC3764316.1 efflux RND transporter permease subunit [Neptunicella marina]
MLFHNIIKWSVERRMLVVLTSCILLVIAAFQLPDLKLDAFPDVTNVQVSINTEAKGLGAEEVEKLISFPIESVMYSLPDVEQVRSISKNGLSVVTVVFNDVTDIYFARQQVFEQLQTAVNQIPKEAGTPTMGPNSSGLGQVYQYLLLADEDSGYDLMQLRSLNDWVVKLLLMPVQGVTEVLSFGGEVRQFQVNLNADKLLAYGLSQQDVLQAVENNNMNAGGWYISRAEQQLVVRGIGWLQAGELGLKQIAQIPVKTLDGTVVTVSDLAQVEWGAEIRQGAVTMTQRDKHGQVQALGEVVSGIVLKRTGANTKATIDDIKQRVTLIQQALPQGVSFRPFYDQSNLVEQAVNTVVKALLIAFVFILLVLLLFLLDLKATLLVILSVPISIALALLVMSLFGMSANLMSLGGIAVAIGMLVDGSVVMVENLLSHGNNARQTDFINAASAVAKPVFFAALIILVVFLPLFSFEGVEAKLFEPMAISIMLAIVAAVAVALVLIPALASLTLRTNKTRVNPIMLRLENGYRQLLFRLTRHRNKIVLLTMGLFALSLVLASKLGSEFVPELEEGTINLRVTLAPSASLDTALTVAPKLEAMLMTFPEVTYALSRIGRAEIGGDPEPVNNIEIYIGLLPVSQWTSATNRFELQHKMQQQLEQHPGLLFTFSQPIATRVDELLSGVKSQLAIKLFGPDLEVLAQKGQQLEQLVLDVTGTRDVALEQNKGEAQLIVEPDREALSRYGLSVADLMQLVSQGIGGVSAGSVIEGNERYDIYVRLAAEYRDQIDAINALILRSPSGAWVRVQDVAQVKIQSGLPQIRRDDVQRRLVVEANVQGRDMGSVVADIRQRVNNKLDLPAGYSVVIGGQFESQQRAEKRLMLMVPVSLALIALLLFITFASWSQVALILINVPLAMIGGIVSLYVSGLYISVPASVGFITLFGVAVLNGVVMVDSINARLGSGIALNEAVLSGAASRLRPVLMTAITSALGLIPVLSSTGVGAEIQRPLATVIVGGIVSATFLTLIILPLLYPVFSGQKRSSGF